MHDLANTSQVYQKNSIRLCPQSAQRLEAKTWNYCQMSMTMDFLGVSTLVAAQYMKMLEVKLLKPCYAPTTLVYPERPKTPSWSPYQAMKIKKCMTLLNWMMCQTIPGDISSSTSMAGGFYQLKKFHFIGGLPLIQDIIPCITSSCLHWFCQWLPSYAEVQQIQPLNTWLSPSSL